MKKSKSKKSYKKKWKKWLLFAFGPTGAAALFLLVFCLIRSIIGTDSALPASNDPSKNLLAEQTGSTETEMASESETETETTRFAEPFSITVSMLGDCTLGTDENFYYETSLNAYYDVNGSAYFFQNVKSILEADDLTIANLEGTLTDSTTRADKQFAFKGPAEYTSILTSGSVEAVNVANNHSHDYGDESYTDTLENLKNAGITSFGYNETAIVEVKGIKIGLVGIYELADHLERTHQLKVNIQKVQAEGADLVFVVFHWGNEKETTPDYHQLTLAQTAIDNGADLVVGHHPHVLQGVGTYNGKTIAYSLGNFCFGGNSAPSDMDTMIFQQTFHFDVDGSYTIEEANLIPCRLSSDYYTNNYQPTPAEGDEASRILQKIEERSAGLAQ